MNKRALAVLLLFAGCATYTPNARLQHFDRTHGYRFSNVAATAGEDETFVILAFSGGGTRAAALSYGVLQELARTRIHGGAGTLLDEVDVISSVSGGSFTAAAYALAGRMPLEGFERDFLRHDVQRDLLYATINPRNWLRLLSSRFSRSDLATEYYDTHIFDRKRFSDLPRKRPYIVLNATEIDLGSRFEFTQEQFDPICSDLDAMKIGRAVAASSAFPLLLTAVTLHNYSGTCSYQEPEWVANAMDDRFINPSRFRTAIEQRAYSDSERRFIQLMDGGLADNIGLRGPLRALSSNDPGFSVLRLMNRGRVKRVVVIDVDAEKGSGVTLDRNESQPTVVQVLNAVSNTPMANYSFDTLELLRESISAWNKDQAVSPDGLRQIAFYRVHIAFASLPPAERKFFDDLPTSFALKSEQIDALLAVGPRLLRESADYQKLLTDLK
ncbi:MAG TPA: patatin-like phospholipase family protein [Thermoanaerobaculia bacterium]|nr:patatin-like phospholipase family protein [Thermoanaerobaculia bacterium]